MSYQIGYSSTTSGAKECPPTSYNKTVSVVQKRYRVSDLDPRLQYCVWVAARTSVGVGPFTHTLIPRKTVLHIYIMGIIIIILKTLP